MSEQIVKYYAGTFGTTLTNQSAPSGETNPLTTNTGSSYFKHYYHRISFKVCYSDHFDYIYVISLLDNVIWIFSVGGDLKQFVKLGYGSGGNSLETQKSIWQYYPSASSVNDRMGTFETFTECGTPAVVYDGKKECYILIMTKDKSGRGYITTSINDGYAYYIKLESDGLVSTTNNSLKKWTLLRLNSSSMSGNLSPVSSTYENNALICPDNVFQFGGDNNQSTSRLAFFWLGNIYIIDNWRDNSTGFDPSSKNSWSSLMSSTLSNISQVGIHHTDSDFTSYASNENGNNLDADRGMRIITSSSFPSSASQPSKGGQGCLMQYCYNLEKMFIVDWQHANGGGLKLYSASLSNNVSDGDTITWSSLASLPGYGTRAGMGILAGSAISYDSSTKIIYWKSGSLSADNYNNDYHHKYLRSYNTQNNTWSSDEWDFDYQTEILDKYWDSGTARTDMTASVDPSTVSNNASWSNADVIQHPKIMPFFASKNKGYFFMMGGVQSASTTLNIPGLYNNTLLGLGKLPGPLTSFSSFTFTDVAAISSDGNLDYRPAYKSVNGVGQNSLTYNNQGRLITKEINGVEYDFIWADKQPFDGSNITNTTLFYEGIHEYYGESEIDADQITYFNDDTRLYIFSEGSPDVSFSRLDLPFAWKYDGNAFFYAHDADGNSWGYYNGGRAIPYLIFPRGQYAIFVDNTRINGHGNKQAGYYHQTTASIAGTSNPIKDFFRKVSTVDRSTSNNTTILADANSWGVHSNNPTEADVFHSTDNQRRYMFCVVYKKSKRNSNYVSPSQAEATSAGITSEKVTAIKEATFTMSGTKGIPATAALNAIENSLTGNKAQINRKRRAAIKLLFAGDSIGETKQLVIPRAKLGLSNTFVQEKVLLVKPGSDPINVTTDMSGDEGFYSALADGETFSVILASGNKYTFTRGDEGSEERYTVDISGDSWTGISVNKLTGCANFDTSDPSASGSYLVQNDVVGIDGRRFFIGSVGDGGNEIFTGGDPYITPMYGNTYKLPVDEKIYRMFDNNKETDRFLINVEMKKPNKEYAEALNKKILALNPDADPNSVYFSENMSFMTRVFIQCGNQGLIYDLEEWKLIDKTKNCHVVIEDMDVNRPTMEEYKDEKRVTRRMVFKTKTMGNMIVYVEKYENPQIRSGLNVSQNTNTTNFVGALIRQSKPESIQVNSLVSREMLGEDALVECEADTLSIEYFGNVKTGQKGIRIFK